MNRRPGLTVLACLVTGAFAFAAPQSFAAPSTTETKNLLTNFLQNTLKSEQIEGQPVVKNRFDSLPRKGSLMFREEDLSQLYDAYNTAQPTNAGPQNLAGGRGSATLTDITGGIGIVGAGDRGLAGGSGRAILTDLTGSPLLGADGRTLSGGVGREVLTDLKGTYLLGTLSNRTLAGLIGMETLVDLVGKELAELIGKETLDSLRNNETLRAKLGPQNLGKVEDAVGNKARDIIQEAIKSLPTSAPSFYLSSVVFYAPDNWSVWINGKRIRVGDELNGIKITRVREDNVEIVWRTLDLDFISPNWQSKLEPIKGKAVEKKKDEGDKAKTAADEKAKKEREEFRARKKTEFMAKQKSTFMENKETAWVTTHPNARPTAIERQIWLSEWDTTEQAKLEVVWEGIIKEEVNFEQQRETAKKQAEEIKKVEQRLQAFNTNVFKWNYRSKDGGILVDSEAGAVKFTLGINESFATYYLAKAEGPVESRSLAAVQAESATRQTLNSTLNSLPAGGAAGKAPGAGSVTAGAQTAKQLLNVAKQNASAELGKSKTLADPLAPGPNDVVIKEVPADAPAAAAPAAATTPATAPAKTSEAAPSEKAS